jgi:hypothetical protein
MTTFDWESSLKQWSCQRLEELNEERKAKLPPEVIESSWLGYPGATEEEIASAEAGKKLQFVFNNPDMTLLGFTFVLPGLSLTVLNVDF